MFRKKGLVDYIAPFVLGTSIFAAPLNCINAQDKKPDATASIDDLTQSEVDNLMKRESVDDILKEEYASGRIQKVTYDSSAKKTNFKKLVYQEDLPAKDKKPVLMLVADGDGKGMFTNYNLEKTDAIIIKKIAKKYADFKIISYDPSIDPEFKEIDQGKVNFGTELKTELVTSRPSILLYSCFDLTKGETKEKNDGNIKKLDILRGAPTNNKGIVILHKDLDTDWLPTNVTNPNHKYVWRTLNKGIKWTKLEYTNS